MIGKDRAVFLFHRLVALMVPTEICRAHDKTLLSHTTAIATREEPLRKTTRADTTRVEQTRRGTWGRESNETTQVLLLAFPHFLLSFPIALFSEPVF